MSSIEDGAAMEKGAEGAPFPTSQFASVPLARPLGLFGASFAVEVSSPLSLGPDTVLRAAIGKSIKTLLREDGLLQPLVQLRYGLLRKHKLTATTRATVLRAVGPMMSASLASVLDGGSDAADLQKMSDWQCLGATRGTLSKQHLLDIIIVSFSRLDEFRETAAASMAANRPDEAEAMLTARFGNTVPAWRTICPALSLQACFLIETSLLVLAEAEALTSRGGARWQGQESSVERLLDARAKPIGNWLREVVKVTRSANLADLSRLLSRKQLRHRDECPISHDTLKGWSSMKPGMLMTLDGSLSLLKVIADDTLQQTMLSRFALARFLAFLCDFLRASVLAEPPTWKDAQRMLSARYLQIAEAGAEWLTSEMAGAENNTRHPPSAVDPIQSG